MTRPADTMPDTGLRRCGCCGRQRAADAVAELGVTPVSISALATPCGPPAAPSCSPRCAKSGSGRCFLRFTSRARAPYTATATIPILPSSDLDRTTAFYARAGFADAERYDGYLVLHNDDVELHFAHHDTVTASTCCMHVTDAMKMWRQLRDLGVDGVGEIADQDYGLREFVLTDPDSYRVRIGSSRRDRS